MSTPPDKRTKMPLYTVDGMVIGTLLGTLIAGIYMMMHNYVTLGAVRLAKVTILVGTFLYTTIILLAWTITNRTEQPFLWVALLSTLAQTGLVYLASNRLQGASIRYYAERGSKVHSTFRSVLVGLFAGMLSLGLLIVIALVNVIVTALMTLAERMAS